MTPGDLIAWVGAVAVCIVIVVLVVVIVVAAVRSIMGRPTRRARRGTTVVLPTGETPPGGAR